MKSSLLPSHAMVGTDKGEFVVFDMEGTMVAKQKICNGQIMSIKPRTSSMGKNLNC